MNRFQLTIELGNDAMRSMRDVAAALQRVADALKHEGIDDVDWPSGRIRDVNGNTVGQWEVTCT